MISVLFSTKSHLFNVFIFFYSNDIYNCFIGYALKFKYPLQSSKGCSTVYQQCVIGQGCEGKGRARLWCVCICVHVCICGGGTRACICRQHLITVLLCYILQLYCNLFFFLSNMHIIFVSSSFFLSLILFHKRVKQLAIFCGVVPQYYSLQACFYPSPLTLNTVRSPLSQMQPNVIVVTWKLCLTLKDVCVCQLLEDTVKKNGLSTSSFRQQTCQTIYFMA